MLRLGLLLPQEVDNKVLVLLYEVIRETLLFQVIAKMFPPLGIKGLENAEFGLVTIDIPRRLPAKVPDRRSSGAGSVWGRRWRRGVPMSSEDTTQQTVFVVAACARRYSSERCRLGCLARVLFPIVHLLLELLRLLFVDER